MWREVVRGFCVVYLLVHPDPQQIQEYRLTPVILAGVVLFLLVLLFRGPSRYCRLLPVHSGQMFLLLALF